MIHASLGLPKRPHVVAWHLSAQVWPVNTMPAHPSGDPEPRPPTPTPPTPQPYPDPTNPVHAPTPRSPEIPAVDPHNPMVPNPRIDTPGWGNAQAVRYGLT